MNSKKFLFLLALAIFLLSFSIFGSDQTSSISKNEISPIVGVDGTSVKKIVISSAENTVELAVNNDKWVVASRDNYGADFTKVNSLLLKLLSTQNVQLVPTSPEGLKELGLDQDAEKQGITTKITLYDDQKLSAGELSGIMLGNMRPSNPENPASSPSQYVRPTNSQQIMILKNPIIAPARAQDWINTELINVLGKSFYRLETFLNGAASFVIKRKDINDDKVEVYLTSELPKGKVERQAIISQQASGLENVGISDVISATNSQQVAELNFDRESRYYLKNGLVYSVFTAQAKDDPKTAYAKISVGFDPKLVEEVSAATSSSSSSSVASSSSSSSSSSSKAIEFSTAEEATKLTELYKNWIYKLPEFSSGKFRKNLEDFYENKPEEKSVTVKK